MSEHGYRGYRRGCRCDICRAANSVRINRYRQARVRHGGKVNEHGISGGFLRVPVLEVLPLLEDLRYRRTWPQVARLCGVPQDTLREILYRKRKAVEAKTAAAIRSAWADANADTRKDGRRYPVEPLIDAVIARYGSIKAAGDKEARSLYRFEAIGSLSEEQADRWASRLLECTPYEVWDVDDLSAAS